ncbi:DUF3168 domain-containing protein [Massilia sp. HP4]|uniref:DUF3168 domain-containing protein n=1 Tax=Massilia sp. HP4 TaxID=2562316 RepID=UPI0010BFACB5|nr:DUF3168 domain-containing protein [Massilia sp. HP4]
MTPEDHIDAVLQHLAGGRVFPDVAPLNTERPFVTYQLVGGAPDNYLSGDLPEKQQVRMQVNVWVDRRAEASEIGMLVEDAMRSAAHLQVEVITGRVATYDEETDLRGTMQDFSMYC